MSRETRNTQSRLESFVEICLNTSLGFLVSFTAWPFVAAAFGYPYSVSHNLGITAIFTVLSLLRGFVVRRFFETVFHKLARRISRGIERAAT